MLMLTQTSTSDKPKTSSGCELGVTDLHNTLTSSPSIKNISKPTIIWEVQVAHLTTVRMGISK